jgi:DNA-binding transcriptional regulator YdaS (Cro superfamily)
MPDHDQAFAAPPRGTLKTPAQQALREACDVAGGQKPLAARIGTTQSMVWYWLERARRGVPGEYVLLIERATGISRHALRPDIFPHALEREATAVPSSPATNISEEP